MGPRCVRWCSTRDRTARAWPTRSSTRSTTWSPRSASTPCRFASSAIPTTSSRRRSRDPPRPPPGADPPTVADLDGDSVFDSFVDLTPGTVVSFSIIAYNDTVPELDRGPGLHRDPAGRRRRNHRPRREAGRRRRPPRRISLETDRVAEDGPMKPGPATRASSDRCMPREATPPPRFSRRPRVAVWVRRSPSIHLRGVQARRHARRLHPRSESSARDAPTRRQTASRIELARELGRGGRHGRVWRCVWDRRRCAPRRDGPRVGPSRCWRRTSRVPIHAWACARSSSTSPRKGALIHEGPSLRKAEEPLHLSQSPDRGAQRRWSSSSKRRSSPGRSARHRHARAFAATALRRARWRLGIGVAKATSRLILPRCAQLCMSRPRCLFDALDLADVDTTTTRSPRAEEGCSVSVASRRSRAPSMHLVTRERAQRGPELHVELLRLILTGRGGRDSRRAGSPPDVASTRSSWAHGARRDAGDHRRGGSRRLRVRVAARRARHPGSTDRAEARASHPCPAARLLRRARVLQLVSRQTRSSTRWDSSKRRCGAPVR